MKKFDLEKFINDCDSEKQAYIDLAYQTQMSIVDMEPYFDIANQIEKTKRAVKDYVENGFNFSDTAFEQ